MSFVPDEYEKTVCIPVRIVKGRVTYFYGGKMPELDDGAIGDLILPAYCVKNPDALLPMQEERPVPLQAAGAVVLLGMRDRYIPSDLRPYTVRPQPYALDPAYNFAVAILMTDLDLLLRGTKKAVLRGGECWLPDLHRPAISLNHAYALLSSRFEPARDSHTGNAFQRGLYHDGAAWRRLEDARNQHEAAYERESLLPKKRGKPTDTSKAEPPKSSRKEQATAELPLTTPPTAQALADLTKNLRLLTQRCLNAYKGTTSPDRENEIAEWDHDIWQLVTALYEL